ncbi:hypothetical protein BLNAU_1289 [Blattamonas nauphoetae]|uniref:Mitochondrial splicing suppressor 51 zinc-finger domain-containing protein n=1 Tax=Blattamonas nauphoetae TaxID=2049346 RepID=A0ABQ9YIZ2_9EUKA|nr:hypothetical protein BLNAU_1289 [Blattamonas nauphoetae]
MSSLVVPSDITNAVPPPFLYTLLSVQRNRLRRAQSVYSSNATKATALLKRQVEYIEKKLLEYIDSDDSSHWEFIHQSTFFIYQPFCEFCFEPTSVGESNHNTTKHHHALSDPSVGQRPHFTVKPTTLSCPICGVSFYCSKEHCKQDQMAHWKICNALQSMNKVEINDIYSIIHENEDLDLQFSTLHYKLKDYDQDDVNREALSTELTTWLTAQDNRVFVVEEKTEAQKSLPIVERSINTDSQANILSRDGVIISESATDPPTQERSTESALPIEKSEFIDNLIDKYKKEKANLSEYMLQTSSQRRQYRLNTPTPKSRKLADTFPSIGDTPTSQPATPTFPDSTTPLIQNLSETVSVFRSVEKEKEQMNSEDPETLSSFLTLDVANALIGEHEKGQDMLRKINELELFIKSMEEQQISAETEWNKERSRLKERNIFLEERHKVLVDLRKENERMRNQYESEYKQKMGKLAEEARLKEQELRNIIARNDAEKRDLQQQVAKLNSTGEVGKMKDMIAELKRNLSDEQKKVEKIRNESILELERSRMEKTKIEQELKAEMEEIKAAAQKTSQLRSPPTARSLQPSATDRTNSTTKSSAKQENGGISGRFERDSGEEKRLGEGKPKEKSDSGNAASRKANLGFGGLPNDETAIRIENQQKIDEDKRKADEELERKKREAERQFQEEKRKAEEAITRQFATDDTKQPLNTAQPASTSKPANSSNSANTETPSTANTKTGLSLSLSGAADGTVRVSTQSPRTPPTTRREMGEEKKDGRTRGMDGRTRGMNGRTQLDAVRDSEWGGEERDDEEEVFEKAKFRNLEIELNTFGTQTSPRSPFTHSPHPHVTHNQSTSTSSSSLNVSIPTQTSPRGPLSPLSLSALQQNTTVREAKSTKWTKQPFGMDDDDLSRTYWNTVRPGGYVRDEPLSNSFLLFLSAKGEWFQSTCLPLRVENESSARSGETRTTRTSGREGLVSPRGNSNREAVPQSPTFSTVTARPLSALTRDEERGSSSRDRLALPLSPQKLAQEQWNREQAERDEKRDADMFRLEFRRIGEAFLPSALHPVPTHSCIVLIRDMKVVGHFPAPATHTLSPRQHTPHAAPPSSSFVSSPIPLSARPRSAVSQKMVSPTLRTSHSDRTGTKPLSITIPGQAASPLLSPLDSRKKKTKRDDSDAIRFYTPPFNKFRPSSDDPTDRARMKECMVVSPIAQTPLSAESVEEPELDADDVISRNLEMMGRLRGMDGRMAATGSMSMRLSATVPTSAGPTAPTISFVDPLDLRTQERQKRLGSQYGATTRPVSATVMGVRGPKRMRG